MRKPIIMAVAMLSCLMLYSFNSQAQENKDTNKSSTPSTQNQPPARPRANPEERLNRVSERLGLNAEQKTKLKDVFESEAKAMRELRSDTSLTAEDRRAKLRKLREQSNEKINAFLTDEQKTKYKEMQNEMRQAGNRGNRPNRNTQNTQTPKQ